jgi:hypothetical protein
MMVEPILARRESDPGSKIGARTEETDISNHNVDHALQVMTVEEASEDNLEPKAKKSLAFKLAFIGLAASGFVFQVDATALGIALPVSITISISFPLYFLTYTHDHAKSFFV